MTNAELVAAINAKDLTETRALELTIQKYKDYQGFASRLPHITTAKRVISKRPEGQANPTAANCPLCRYYHNDIGEQEPRGCQQCPLLSCKDSSAYAVVISTMSVSAFLEACDAIIIACQARLKLLKPPQVDCGNGYRQLELGETLQTGDEWRLFDHEPWRATNSAGTIYTQDKRFPMVYRRRVVDTECRKTATAADNNSCRKTATEVSNDEPMFTVTAIANAMLADVRPEDRSVAVVGCQSILWRLGADVIVTSSTKTIATLQLQWRTPAGVVETRDLNWRQP